MTTRLIITLNIHDPDQFAKYREVAADALAKHGGKVAAAGPTELNLEGKAPKMSAILEFPSDEAAKAWRSDPELADIHALRTGAAETVMFKLPG